MHDIRGTSVSQFGWAVDKRLLNLAEDDCSGAQSAASLSASRIREVAQDL
jgi:hypothetical protein